MPACHHCGEEADGTQWGKCSTCDTFGDFCNLCGWWELGPEGLLEVTRWEEIRAKISPKGISLFEPCSKLPDAQELVVAIVDRCKLMQAQWEKPSLLKSQDYTYQLWRPEYATWQLAANFVCAKLNQLFDTKTTAEDLVTRPTDYDCRLHGMLLTFLSAYQLAAEAQQARLIHDEKGPPLNIHDAAKLAEHHYLSHGGFGDIGETHSLHDSLTLRHVDTIEQYQKGNLNLQMAHALILSDTQSERLSRQIAIHSFMLYSVLLPVFQPYEDQRVPNKGTFNASSNGSAGIFTKADLERHFYDSEASEIKMAPTVLLHRLVVSFEISPLDPDYEKWFKFHSPASLASILESRQLTDLQKIYLLAFQSLDDPECPAQCREILLKRATKAMAKVLGKLTTDQDLQLKMKQTRIPMPFEGIDTQDAGMVRSVIHALVDLFQRGQYPLQTCCTAANIGYIAKGPYKGLLEVYEEPAPLANLLDPCSADHAKVLFSGLRYRLTDVLGAADQRKKSPFQYLSWRVQKDRMAHRFLPMAYGEYDVTAAIAQAYPVPTPNFTYGNHLILWQRQLLGRCTFKIGDSGKPTRSFLALVTEILEQAEEGQIFSKSAIFNLLVLTTQTQAPPLERVDDLIRKPELLAVFPDRPLCVLDLEAHLYGEVGIQDVDLIFAPCSGKAAVSEQKLLLTQAQKEFNTPKVQLYDEDALKRNEQDLEWPNLLVRL